ncbi:heme utilization or adhesion protein [Actinobacillus pleuropneumoniae]|nr:heme utilization or adhesion protein [Actinobacillus pleuropneumoniae]
MAARASVQTENGILENKDFTVMLTERKLGEFYRYQQDRRNRVSANIIKTFFDEKIKSPIDEYTSNESRLNPAINIIGTKLSPIPHSDVTAQSQSGNSQAGNIQLKKADISYDEDKSDRRIISYRLTISIKLSLQDRTLKKMIRERLQAVW